MSNHIEQYDIQVARALGDLKKKDPMRDDVEEAVRGLKDLKSKHVDATTGPRRLEEKKGSSRKTKKMSCNAAMGGRRRRHTRKLRGGNFPSFVADPALGSAGLGRVSANVSGTSAVVQGPSGGRRRRQRQTKKKGGKRHHRKTRRHRGGGVGYGFTGTGSNGLADASQYATRGGVGTNNGVIPLPA